MKRIFVLLAAGLLLFSACTPPKGWEYPTKAPTEAPSAQAAETPGLTYAPTSAPTEIPAPTAEPTEVPEPTEAPDFSALLPKMGKLVDGPIFPEPFKYLVLPGESNMHYVYDANGELLYSFAASMDDETQFDYGLYTEDGICCWMRLRDRTPVTPFVMFAGMAITTRWVENVDDWYCEISLIRDAALENPRKFSNGRLVIGKAGGILPIDGGYLVLNRSVDYHIDGTPRFNEPIIRLDENFKKVGTIDPEPFGMIRGVFGGKYILGVTYLGDDEGVWTWDDSWYGDDEVRFRTDLYTLDGRLVMEGVDPVGNEYFCLDDERWDIRLVAVDFIKDSDGNCLDKDLNHAEEPNTRKTTEEVVAESEHYYRGVRDWYDIRVWSWSAFAGIRYQDYEGEDGKWRHGDWIFRIYNPAYANDNDNTKWDWS